MYVDSTTLSRDQAYRLLSGIVVPRPVAWISSVSAGGIANLAPFSCYTFVSNDPPMLAVSIGLRLGVMKDTARNIRARREYVVNIGDASQVEAVHGSSAAYPPATSEIELLGLGTLPSVRVGVPRLADVPVSMECRFEQAVPFGRDGNELYVGEVLAFHFREGVVRDGKVDTRALNPICRIAGPHYATLGDIMTMREREHVPG